jgi:hypothetical protein
VPRLPHDSREDNLTCAAVPRVGAGDDRQDGQADRQPENGDERGRHRDREAPHARAQDPAGSRQPFRQIDM